MLQKVVAKFSEKDDFDAPLKLTVQQERIFLDSNRPDQIAQLLQSEVSGHYSVITLSERHYFIIRHAASGRLLNIQSTCDISIYYALALLYGEDFATEEKWSAALADIKAGKINIEEAIEQVEVVLDYEGEDEIIS